ncbi:hypothetical protein [Streptomyces sp. B21-083]|uniref:hypothetical protein n=1 Tax=Streptomyces sp. B21-083 TaxID=3039410 RepID=UPI002FEEE9FE
MTDLDRDQLAQDTAEYIVNKLIPDTARFHGLPEVTIHYADDRRPPTTVEGVKAHLLSGGCWFSWMDDRVIAAMNTLHGEPINV